MTVRGVFFIHLFQNTTKLKQKHLVKCLEITQR